MGELIAIISAYVICEVLFTSINPTSRNLQSDVIGNNPWPSITWLVSYPESGTEYTREIVQRVSKTTTATNYGSVLSYTDLTNPHIAYSKDGPYRLTNNVPFPDRYILTETHCTGYCIDCPKDVYVNGWREFHEGCATGNIPVNNNDLVEVRYDTEIVKKVVHLIRDPFDNIVARFHREHAEYKEDNNRDDDWNYSIDPDGFREWCDEKDVIFATKKELWTDPDLGALAKSVPCHGLFYQYALWHNNVYDALGKYGRQLEVLVLHYEDYWDDTEATISSLLGFLELPVIDDPPRFSRPDHFDYYSQNDRTAISSFLKVIASQALWIESKRYLSPPKMERTFAPIGRALSPVPNDSWPEVAWLMTFPNSGTGYTSKLVTIASQSVVATNYAHEVENHEYIPNFARTENGPFRYSSRRFPEHSILTKTHCTAHCIECAPRDKVKNFDDFLRGCAEVWKFEEGLDDNNTGIVKAYYDPKSVKKTVHMIRDPYDNIIARFHYAYKYHRDKNDNDWKYSYNRDGFRAWCEDINSNSGMIHAKVYTQPLIHLSKNVPCHEVFYQYVRWHNHAFRVSRELDIPSLVLHYENYHYDMEKTLTELLDFLELPRIGKIAPFEYHPYEGYFSEMERNAIALFIKSCAFPETYEHMRKYFVQEAFQD